MSAFTADWLALRESADSAARSVGLTTAAAARLPRDGVVRVLDLGTGTGSNARYLLDRLPPRQEWLLVDRDGALLAGVAPRMREWAVAHGLDVAEANGELRVSPDDLMCSLSTRQLDLAAIDETAIVS